MFDKVKTWVKEHKTGIMITLGVVGGAILGYSIAKNSYHEEELNKEGEDILDALENGSSTVADYSAIADDIFDDLAFDIQDAVCDKDTWYGKRIYTLPDGTVKTLSMSVLSDSNDFNTKVERMSDILPGVETDTIISILKEVEEADEE